MVSLYSPFVSEHAIRAVSKVISSGQLAQGPKVFLLEKKFASIVGTKYAVAVNNGTAALHTALFALGIGRGDEVIVPAFTFVATANAVLMVGAEPVFADISDLTLNIDAKSVERLIRPQTKAIIGVNLYGGMADWDELREIAQAYRLYLIEDAAQSMGATLDDRMSGGMGDVGCFSFYATKNLMSGEGGMVVTNSKDLADRAMNFRHHGQDQARRYSYRSLGYNYRMTDIQAVLVMDGLKRIFQENLLRQKNARYYLDQLEGIEGTELPIKRNNTTHAYHQFTIRVKRSFPLSRRQLQHTLGSKDIQTGVYYPKPLYRAAHLATFRREGRDLPKTAAAAKEVLSLPVHPRLTDQELGMVVKEITALR